MVRRWNWRSLTASLIVVLVGVTSGCGGTSSTPEPTPLLGLADFHNHEFAYLGFGGTAISHSVDPSTGCRFPLLPLETSFRVRDLVRQGLFAEAKAQEANGHCYPTITNLGSQRVDTDNLKRAWQYGLRLIVMFAVSSDFLCQVAELSNHCPTDRDAIEVQIQAAKGLQAKIDAEAGGPGQGWYQIVTTPSEARRVIGEGKLAVVLGIEATNAFGCKFTYTKRSRVQGVPPLNPFDEIPMEKAYQNDCSDGLASEVGILSALGPTENLGVDQGTQKALALFEHYWAEGVRDFFLIHNISGIAGGTALSIDLLHANNNPAGIAPGSPLTDRSADINRVLLSTRPPEGSWDCSAKFEYDGGRCNSQGLTETGRELARDMAAHGALIDADHLSWRARRALLDNDGVLGGVYPLISSHDGIASLNHGNGNSEGQMTDEDIDEIIRTGGAFAPRLPSASTVAGEDTYPAGAAVAPYRCGGTSESFVQAFRYLSDKLAAGKLINGKPAFVGVGIGTDMGPPIPSFDAPRFTRPGDVTGVTVPGEGFDVGLLLGGLFVGPSPIGPGHCYAPGEKPMVSYPFKSQQPSLSTQEFSKSTTPWDGRSQQPGYDISFDGVPHIGMIPDFVEELRALGLTDADLQPLWHAAEAYIRTWETANSWADSFDAEGSKGVRAACEEQRAKLLEGADTNDGGAVVAAARELRSHACRATS